MKDVVIVGGGIIGICTAWYLHEEGVHVTIMDAGDFNSGCTYGNAGMIVPSHITPLASPGMMAKGMRWMLKKNSPFYIRPRIDAELLRWLWLFWRSSSPQHVRQCAPVLRDMHEEGREMFYAWSQHPGFDFDFDSHGIVMMYKSRAGEKDEKEGAEFAHEMGIVANVLSSSQLRQLDPAVNHHVLGGVHYPDDATMSPDKFMQQMVSWLRQHGVEFISNMIITDVKEDGKKRCAIVGSNGEVMTARHVIIAGGMGSARLMKASGFVLPMQDGKGYSLTMDMPSPSPVIPAILHEARVAVSPLGDRLRISGTLEISGMDHAINPSRVQSILDAMCAYYDNIPMEKPSMVWYGYRPCTPDGMPYIGKVSGDASIIVATGHAMMGLSLAPATGRMVRDILLKHYNPDALLRPDRFRLRSR